MRNNRALHLRELSRVEREATNRRAYKAQECAYSRKTSPHLLSNHKADPLSN